MRLGPHRTGAGPGGALDLPQGNGQLPLGEAGAGGRCHFSDLPRRPGVPDGEAGQVPGHAGQAPPAGGEL